MRRLLHALLLLCLTATVAHGQTGTAQTKTQLGTEQSTNFPDNNTGLITPALLRQTVVDFITSWQQAPRINAQSTTSYNVSVDDYGKLVTHSNVAAIAVTLPQATTTFAVFNYLTCNLNTGAVTITPTTSTINGNATLVLQQNACAYIISDSTNYRAMPLGIAQVLGTGALTCSETNSGVATCDLTAARKTLPTTSVATAGAHTGGMSANSSGTYTTPANVLWIEIYIIGGGGGGGGGGNGGANGGGGGNTCWNTTGAACSTPVYQAGGGGAGGGQETAAGTGGTIAGSGSCTWQAVGGGGVTGGSFTASTSPGGAGGNTTRGGGAPGPGQGANAGPAGGADTGGGGAGGGTGGGFSPGSGGGGGATCYVVIGTPAATYTYAVGAAGSVGTAGTSGANGGLGASGHIFVIEHYGS